MEEKDFVLVGVRNKKKGHWDRKRGE